MADSIEQQQQQQPRQTTTDTTNDITAQHDDHTLGKTVEQGHAVPVGTDPLVKEQLPPRKSYQLRALGRKTLSYQKRQWFTNICCVSLCPLMMVIISAALGRFIQSLVDKQSNAQDLLYCSNQNASTSLNFPIIDLDDPSLPRTEVMGKSNVGHVNFQAPTGGFGGSAGLSVAPCVSYLDKLYPLGNSTPYDQDPGIPAAMSWMGLDSTFAPAPKGGWLSPSAASLSRYLIQFQLRPWFVYAINPNVNSALVGTRPGPETLPLSDPATIPTLSRGGTAIGGGNATVNGTSVLLPFAPATAATGILGSMEGRLNIEVAGASADAFSSAVFTKVPFYNPTQGTTEDDLDDTIANSIRGIIKELSLLDKSVLFDSDPSSEKITNFLLNASLVLKNMPYGGVYFRDINHAAKSYKYTFQISNDARMSSSAGFPQQGTRQIYQQSQLSNAILRNSNVSQSTNVISHSLRSMPLLVNTKFTLPIASFIGRILFPFGLSFLLPIFVIGVVREKEERILIMMQMNGMKPWVYWLTHYLHFYSLHVISSVVFLVVGWGARMELFRNTELGVLIVVFFLWGHAQVALALFFATFFSKARTALVIVFLLVLVGIMVSLGVETLFRGDTPLAYFIYPPFAFYRVLSKLNTASFSKRLRPYHLNMLVPGDEVFTGCMFLIAETVVLLLAAGYAGTVVQTEYGVARPWHWPVTAWFGKKGVKTLDVEKADAHISDRTFEDKDVQNERARVLANLHDPRSPLIFKGMRKVYTGSGRAPKVAVKDVTLAVEKGVVFGLLGPNGAGKTTLISILTGLYEATEGTATLAGYDIKTEKDDVHKIIGVCPQHDILWDDLTIREHLLFYARLKGTPPSQEKAAVEKSMDMVSLNGDFATRLSKGLSGGEKRRLSIAIALVGNPLVVFLDEPTTGLDPEVRRLIWNIVNDAREGKTIILTTHSMEEAEVLCQRIGIMAKGTLRCLGDQLRLKDLYGSGFKLFFSCQPEDAARASAYIESLLPAGKWTKTDSFSTNVGYEFENEPGVIARLFEEVERNKKENGIEDWGLGQTTLEEVFVRIIGEAEAEAD